MAAAFPEAETEYLAGLFQQRGAEQAKLEEHYRLEGKASKAVGDFLRDSGFENLLEACNELSLTPQELWDQIMQEAGIPKHEMPARVPRLPPGRPTRFLCRGLRCK